jgi:hypothetical protein
VSTYTGPLSIYPEICCEECGEIEHNHFDCPACGLKYAPTDQFCALYEEPPPVIVSCEKCGARFQLMSGDTWSGTWAQLPAEGAAS